MHSTEVTRLVERHLNTPLTSLWPVMSITDYSKAFTARRCRLQSVHLQRWRQGGASLADIGCRQGTAVMSSGFRIQRTCSAGARVAEPSRCVMGLQAGHRRLRLALQAGRADAAAPSAACSATQCLNTRQHALGTDFVSHAPIAVSHEICLQYACQQGCPQHAQHWTYSTIQESPHQSAYLASWH